MKKLLYRITLCCLLVALVLTGCSLLDQTPPSIEGKGPTVEYGTALSVSDVADVTDDHAVAEALFLQNGGAGTVSEDGTSITFPKPGAYTVLISASDERGNKAEAECPVTVVDTTVPEILSVSNEETVGYGTVLTLGGTGDEPNAISVKYEDVSDVTLSISSVQKAGNESAEGCYRQNGNDSVELLQIGDYLLTVEAEDSFGNRSTAQTSVTVADMTPPVLSGLDQIAISEYDALPDFLNGVTANDEIEGDLFQRISVDSSAVQKGVPGTYNVHYSVADTAGNTAAADRVVVIEDTTPPVLTVSKSSLSFTIGGGKPDYKSLVSASDAHDGDLGSKVSIDDSNVDYSKAGTYKVTYTVQDSSGNTSTKTVSVTVKAPAASSSGGGTVYITRTGGKYHSNGCRYLSRSKIAISRSDARARGYTPCSVCRPG